MTGQQRLGQKRLNDYTRELSDWPPYDDYGPTADEPAPGIVYAWGAAPYPLAPEDHGAFSPSSRAEFHPDDADHLVATDDEPTPPF